MENQPSLNPFSAPMPVTTNPGDVVDPSTFMKSLKDMNPDEQQKEIQEGIQQMNIDENPEVSNCATLRTQSEYGTSFHSLQECGKI